MEVRESNASRKRAKKSTELVEGLNASRVRILGDSDKEIHPLTVDGKKEFSNPLLWWKSRVVDYPILSALARQELAIPATSASSERLFSVAGQIVTKKRNRFSGEIVEFFVWLHNYWKMVL